MRKGFCYVAVSEKNRVSIIHTGKDSFGRNYTKIKFLEKKV